MRAFQHDVLLDISNVESYTNTNVENEKMYFSEFVQKLKEPLITKQKGSAGGFVGGWVQDKRTNNNVLTRSMITLDIDDAKSAEKAWGRVDNYTNFACAMYSTHNSRLDEPRYRLIIPLKSAIKADEYKRVAEYVVNIISLDVDSTSFVLSQLMNYPTCEVREQYEFYYRDLPLFNADDVPKDFKEDSRQSMSTLEVGMDLDPSPQMANDEIFKIAKNDKVFNSFFNPDRVDVGKPTIIEYQDYKKVYDSASEADLGLFNKIAFYTQRHTQVEEIARKSVMYREKYERKDYIKRTIEEALSKLTATFQKHEANSNVKGLEINDRNAVVPNARNAERILTSSPFEDVLAFDVFKGTEVIKGNLPWRKRERPDNDYEPWLGSDDKRLLHYFGVNYDFNAAKIIENAYLDVVRRNAFHPVKDYLEAQSWDGTTRAETLFVDYLGAEDTPYTRAVTRKWLAAAVARIYEPGCKFDYMPVLVGPQGAGKSTIIAKLARDWFSDSLKNLDGKEAYEHLQSSWIFEFGELAAMRRNEVEEIKAFITKQTDSYRVAYERIVSDFPRKCVFIGTTNRSDFLRDQTGNRRFWAITTNPMNRKYEISDLTDSVVDQIWAEVMDLYKQGEKLYLDSILEAEARIIQESHMESDPRVGLIEEYLERLLPLDWNTMKIYERVNFIVSGEVGERKRERVCAAEIWSECLGNDHNNFKPFEAAAIYDILRKVEGWEERKPNRTTFKHYGKQTTFIRSI